MEELQHISLFFEDVMTLRIQSSPTVSRYYNVF